VSCTPGGYVLAFSGGYRTQSVRPVLPSNAQRPEAVCAQQLEPQDVVKATPFATAGAAMPPPWM
jgi:hypothetical protein